MTGAIEIFSAASVAAANLAVFCCLLLAGRADRKMKEFCEGNFAPENPAAVEQP